ncbi:MAG: apolipoprotein N-acyltransferase [Bacteroidales bacterium]|nr:apolipoprotein N-acyltransferase [Bacteroidales bacterium]
MNWNKWYIKLALSVLSGLILSLAWYVRGAAIIIMLAFVPLFWLSDISLKEGKRNAFGRGILLFYPAFFVFNLITTYWIAYCTKEGAAAAVVANALLQTLTLSAWHACRKQVENKVLQAVMLIAFWISFEYLHLNWDLTWPWLNLGNVFASMPGMVQWYSITGTLGGTVWILICNFLVYCDPLTNREQKKRPRKVGSIVTLAVLIVPMLISLLMYRLAMRQIDETTPIEAVIVQQNTDPWNEEYRLTNEQHIQRILDVAKPYITAKTNLIITPESAVSHTIEMGALRNHTFMEGDTRFEGFSLFDSVIATYPNLNFVLGLSTVSISDHKTSPVAIECNPGQFMEFYNTAGFYNKKGLVSHYHKSRLVPGVEKMPFPKVFGFLEKAIIELGGSNSSLGTDTAQRVFEFDVDGKKVRVGTGICYESIYGELMGRFVKNGANVLCVITNDSWWDDSPGHGQHFEMSRLRAVETRRYVLRAANGGFSGVISPTGSVLMRTKYNERTAIQTLVCAQTRETFYVKHGDYLARIAVVLAALGLLWTALQPFLRRKRTKQEVQTFDR